MALNVENLKILLPSGEMIVDDVSFQVLHGQMVYPFELSGGMLQRLMIAAAIIQEPELLVADEAATAIDACNRLELMGQIKQFCGLGMSVLLVTHDLKASSVSDRIMIMNHGKIVETGQTDLVMNCPKDECTKELVNASYLRRGADDRTK